MFQNPKGFKLSIWTGARDKDNPSVTYFLEPQYLREVQLLYGLSERPVETLKNKMNIGVSELTNAVLYMATKGVPPPVVKNSKGEVIGGSLLEMMDVAKNWSVPMGAEKKPNIDQPILTKADLVGFTLKKARIPLGAPSGQAVSEAREAGKTFDYLKERAFRELEQNPDQAAGIVKKYELPPSTIINWKKNQRSPFVNLYKRNRRAIEMFRKKD